MTGALPVQDSQSGLNVWLELEESLLQCWIINVNPGQEQHEVVSF